MGEGVVELPDGRSLSYAIWGDPDGEPVIHHHGGSSSRLELVTHDQDLAARGACVVVPDRPGFGGSTPAPLRPLDAWVPDAVCLADQLGIERFVVTGASAGGPYALATAAGLPERVTAVGTIASIADLSWPLALDGMPTILQEYYLELRRGPERVHELTAQYLERDLAAAILAMPVSARDLDVMSHPERVQALLPAAVEAFRQGFSGFAADQYALLGPWRSSMSDISVPVHVWHGTADTVSPPSHAEHIAEVIGGASLRLLPDEGHISALLDYYADLVATVLAVDPGCEPGR